MPNESIQAFEKLRQVDPFRLDNMSTLSNQYYVSQKRTELSILVREMWKIEKYHWETCVVTGNYFSLRQDRPRAITYFQRALQMKPDFISAWTLIGHEYLELRNFTQAIHSYHKGTTLDPNDCRAWFGLGQAYDFQKMHSFAIRYYLKAANLKPSDERLWIAVGDVYQELDSLVFAQKAYKRAINCDGNHLTQSLEKMAQLCERQKLAEKAAKYWEKYIQIVDQDGMVEEKSTGHTRAYIYLSRYYLDKKDFQNVELYAKKCLGLVQTREHGNQMLKIITEMSETRPEPEGKETEETPKETDQIQTMDDYIMAYCPDGFED